MRVSAAMPAGVKRGLRLSACCLPLMFWGVPILPAFAAAWAPDLTTSTMWDSNATNADRSPDAIGALQLRAEFEAARLLSLGRDDALFFGAHLVAEAWPRFDGLDRVTFGPQLSWRHKFGLGAYAHLIRIELTGEVVAAHESGRAGLTGRAAIVWRKRLDPATRFALTYARSRHDARAAVFDRTGHEAAIELGHDLDERWSVSLITRWREGDVLSYASPPRPDLVSLAKVLMVVGTFDQIRVAYSLNARTVGGSLATSCAVNDTTSLTIGYDFRRTDSGPLHYVNHLVSVGLAHQF